MNTSILMQLLDIGRRMAETRTLGPLLIYAVDTSLELLHGQYGYLVLVREDGALDFRVMRDRHGNNIPQPEGQISRTIFSRVLESGKPVYTASATQDPNFRDASSVNTLQLRSVLCVPLISHGKVLGALYLENRKEDNLFTGEDLEPLQYLAAHAAICIDNALMNEELEAVIARRNQIFEEADKPFGSKFDTQEQMAIQSSLERERMDILYDFIQDASHQFRTPLSVIYTTVDILARKLDLEANRSYLQRIHTQVDTIVNLVDSLAMMAKLDREFTIDDTEINLGDLVHHLCDAFEERASDNEQHIEVVQGEEAILVPGMVEYMRQALAHVLTNALLYSGPGTSVRVSVGVEDNVAVVTVEDTGIGIAENELQHIFTRFYRSDKAGTTRGLGLGLSIVQKIMRLHHGKIEVQSRVGQGSVFRLLFPMMDGKS